MVSSVESPASSSRVPFSALSKAICPGDFLPLFPPEGFDGRFGDVFASGLASPSVDISAASITTGLVEFFAAAFFFAAGSLLA